MTKNEKLFIEELHNRGFEIKEEYVIEALECVDECTACDEEPMTIPEYVDYMLNECNDMFTKK